MIKFAQGLAIFAALLIFALIFRVGDQSTTSGPSVDISYTAFKGLVTQGDVERVKLKGDEISGTLISPQILAENQKPTEKFKTIVPSFGDSNLLKILDSAGVDIKVASDSGGIWDTVVWIIPWMMILGFYFWLSRRSMGNIAGGAGRGSALDKLLRPQSQQSEQQIPDVNFNDVAGQANAKREVAELINFLHQPERYERLGAKVPKGILLMGAPGTGKTLLAKALAGEADVPFFSISASEFIEVFVGVGASRVRNLFADAKNAAPSIIFIDELDSIGRVRGTGLGGGNDEREQTLNQILAELDGFSGREAVVVLAATNRPDVLDPALLRPGRFDRHITLDLPDRAARVDILRVHLRDVPVDDDVDLEIIAASTPGFSGADLKNLVNEAAMLAARENADKVCRRHFETMRERVVLGSVRTLAIEADERRRLAAHEAGHTVAAYFLPHTDPPFKVSIIPRGRALGVTQQIPEREHFIMDEDFLRARLAVMLGGRAAERKSFETVSSGADDDIHQATNLARMMVSRWGMSDEVGPVDARQSEEHPFLGREIAQPRRMSEMTALAVDTAVRDLLVEAERRANEVLETHNARFQILARSLEERETLDQEEIENILGSKLGVLEPKDPSHVVS